MVYDSGSQRALRPNDDQLDAVLPDGVAQGRDVRGTYIQVAGQPGGAGVARGSENLGGTLALRQLPDQGMLTGAATNYQYLQAFSLVLSSASGPRGLPSAGAWQ
jgi:hypothetical protein